ncbi:hypothetical protein MMC13_003935 [Lambiella insularis]|nr:hypothetical protein [Lambiella insularis]
MLAQILLKVGDAETFPVLRELLLSASALEDEAATMILVNQAVETNRMSHPDIAGPRAHLARLAQASHPAAVVLQAELLAAQGQTDKALRMCEDVVQADIDDYMGADVLGDSAKRKAWNAIAKLRKEKGDMAGAKLALEAAAFHHDDPWAYYYLADNYRRPDDSQYLLFMLKAAASGIPNAAYKLGRYYLGLTRLSKKKLEQRNDPGFREALAFGTKYKEEEKRLLAAEWFSVAAESPAHKKIDDSRVYLALLLRAQGDLAGGRTLLKQAANSVVWGPNAVPWFLERWSSQQDFLTMEFLEKNMEQVVQGEYKGT